MPQLGQFWDLWAWAAGSRTLNVEAAKAEAARRALEPPWYCRWGLVSPLNEECQPIPVTYPPAPPASYPFIGPRQTPEQVIAAQAAATERLRREEAARQAAIYATWPTLKLVSAPSNTGWVLPVAAAALAAFVLLRRA